MKKLNTLPLWLLVWLGLTCLVWLTPGCASTPKVDWDQRIGKLTFDDAVRELGPPVASTRLQDGSQVAEWFLKHASQMSFGFGMGGYGPSGGVGVGQTVTPPPKAYYLRLTFGIDGRLERWEKIKR